MKKIIIFTICFTIFFTPIKVFANGRTNLFQKYNSAIRFTTSLGMRVAYSVYNRMEDETMLSAGFQEFIVGGFTLGFTSYTGLRGVDAIIDKTLTPVYKSARNSVINTAKYLWSNKNKSNGKTNSNQNAVYNENYGNFTNNKNFETKDFRNFNCSPLIFSEESY